jgi:hypothetical protein
VIEAINLILSGGIGNKQKKVDSLFFGLEITEIIKKGEVENWEFYKQTNISTTKQQNPLIWVFCATQQKATN